MALIPPQPAGVLPGSGYWNDWIEKIRFIVNNLSAGNINHNDLQNIQGGTTTERYHLTAAQQTNVANLATTYSPLGHTHSSEDLDVPVYAKRYDEIDANTAYLGDAVVGSAESGAVWRIQKLAFSGNDVAITWADGDSNFNNVWDNRTSLTYS